MSAGVRKEPWSVLEAEARALLRRAEAPPLARLIAMIRDVNPTGRRVGRSEADARYAIKSSLQSVLIRLYRDELSVEPHPSDGGVVSLRHDLLDVDACHAVVESLDDDARTWVEEAITGAPAAPRAGRDARAKGARSARREGVEREGDLVAQGRAAMEAYDYELARSLFVRAFEAVPATTEATLALLDLLVDALASDEEALAIVPRITPAAMGSPEVIARLAIAAARAEREELALQWATACTSPRGVDAFDVLARAALRRGDTARAADLLATVRDRAPSHPSVVSIERVRTMFSPRCWATSSTRRTGSPVFWSVLVVSRAFRIAGRGPSNSTSTTAPMTWAMRPLATAPWVGRFFGLAVMMSDPRTESKCGSRETRDERFAGE